MSDQRQLPTGSPFRVAPIACDASSRTRKPILLRQLPDRSCSVGCPQKCTGTTTFGSRRRSRADEFLLASAERSCSRCADRCRRNRPRRRSTARSSPTQRRCSGRSRASRPAPDPTRQQAMCSAEVALLTATACGARTRSRTASRSAAPPVPASGNRTAARPDDGVDVRVGNVLAAVGNHRHARSQARSMADLVDRQELRVLPEWYSNPEFDRCPAPRRAIRGKIPAAANWIVGLITIVIVRTRASDASHRPGT